MCEEGCENAFANGLFASFQIMSTPRFDVPLLTHLAKEQYQFNWLDLLADKEEKEGGQQRNGQSSNSQNGLSSLDPYASDDEDQLQRLAAKFEKKYGGSNNADAIRKKKKKQKNRRLRRPR